MLAKKRKLAYWGRLVGALCVYAALLYALVCAPVVFSGESRMLLPVVGVLGVALYDVYRLLAERGLRRAGLSAEGTESEALPTATDMRRRATLRVMAGDRIQARAAMTTALMVLLPVILRPGDPGWLPWLALLPASAILWLVHLRGRRTVAEASEAGLSDGATHVPWEQVGHCEVHTEYDPLGRTSKVECVVHGHDGAELLRMDLTDAPARTREEFLAALRGEERPELIASEAPAGRGTEVIAGSEPVVERPVPETPGRAGWLARLRQ